MYRFAAALPFLSLPPLRRRLPLLFARFAVPPLAVARVLRRFAALRLPPLRPFARAASCIASVPVAMLGVHISYLLPLRF